MSEELEKMLAILSVYLEPDIFLPDFVATFKKGEDFDIKKVKRYNELLLGISWFTKKVAKYQVYFESFYPNTEDIPPFEALEHHIHAYLEDGATVKNKLSEYIGALKNDIVQVAINKKEVKDALTFVDGQVHQAFASVLGLRRAHRHRGYKFVDSNVIDAEIANMMLLLGNTPALNGMLKPEAVERFTQQKASSFEKGKKFWLENAQKNSVQVAGIVGETIEKTKDFLFNFLSIEPGEFPAKQ